MTLAAAQFTKVLPHGCAYLFFALLLRYVLLPEVMNATSSTARVRST